jgi:hypothetical protein
MQVKGYPTLKVLHKGEEYKAYRGESGTPPPCMCNRYLVRAARRSLVGGAHQAASEAAHWGRAPPHRSHRCCSRRPCVWGGGEGFVAVTGLYHLWILPTRVDHHRPPRTAGHPLLPAGARDLEALKAFVEEAAAELLNETTE